MEEGLIKKIDLAIDEAIKRVGHMPTSKLKESLHMDILDVITDWRKNDWRNSEAKFQQEREDKLMDKAIDTYKPAIQALEDEEWPPKTAKGAWGKEKERHLSKHQEISDKIQKKWFEALNPKPINN